MKSAMVKSRFLQAGHPGTTTPTIPAFSHCWRILGKGAEVMASDFRLESYPYGIAFHRESNHSCHGSRHLRFHSNEVVNISPLVSPGSFEQIARLIH
jgi:hypothetical protein